LFGIPDLEFFEIRDRRLGEADDDLWHVAT
jgi:hypothetical protein